METKHIHHMYALKPGISLSRKKIHYQFINVNSHMMGVLRIPSYNINAKFFPTIVLKYLHRNNFNNHEHTVANKNKTKQKTAHTHLQ